MTERSSPRAKRPTESEADEPKLGRRERNRQEKLARILNAARVLFREKGFQNTTVTEIAEAADIGFGTLFLYAKSKEELLVMVFKDEMNEVCNKTYAKLPDKPVLDQVLFLFEGFIAYHKRDVPLARALMKEIFFLDNPVRRAEVMKLMRNIYGRLADIIDLAKTRGTIRKDANRIQLARNLFAIYVQLLNAWLGGYTDYPRFMDVLPKALALQLAEAAPAKSAKRR